MMQTEATVREIGNPWLDDEEPAYSLAEMVKLFTDNGIKVSDSHIGGFGIHDFLPAIWFKTGDWATGERIAEIARQHELPVFSFDLMWLPYRKGRQIRWHMEFRRGVVRPS